MTDLLFLDANNLELQVNSSPKKKKKNYCSPNVQLIPKKRKQDKSQKGLVIPFRFLVFCFLGRRRISPFQTKRILVPMPLLLLPHQGRRGKGRGISTSSLVGFLFCFVVLWGGCDAVKGSKKESLAAMSNQVTEIIEFGFDRTGTMSVEVVDYPLHVDDQKLGIFLCTQTQKKKLLATPDIYSTFCRLSSDVDGAESVKYNMTYTDWAPKKNLCELNMRNPLDDDLDLYSVQRYDLYSLSILSCTESSNTFERIIVDYELINPGGNHLSTADWALPKMYAYCFLGWVLVMFIFVMAMAGHALEQWYYAHPDFGNPDLAWMIESQTRSRSMHFALFLAAATKAGVVMMDAILWKMLKSIGYRVSWVVMMKNVLFSVSECVIFAWLLLAGLGWCVVVREVDPDEIQTLSSSLVALALSLLFFSMYNSSEDMMSLVVMYVFILPNIFSNIHNNVDGLRFHLTWLRGLLAGANRGEINEDDGRALEWMVRALTSKINFYRSLKALLIGYLVSILAVNVSTIFLPWWGAWLSSLGYECLLLGFVFRVFLIVWPSRWKDGLFWFQGEEGDDDAIYDWTDFGRRLLGLGGGWESGARNPRGEEYIEKIREFDQNVSKKVALVQFPVGCKEKGKEKEKEDEERKREQEKENKKENKEEKELGENKGGWKGEEDQGEVEEMENIDPDDDAELSSSSSSTPLNDVVIDLSPSALPSPSPPNTPSHPLLPPSQSGGGAKPAWAHQLEGLDDDPETPQNVYLALPSYASRHLQRGEDAEVEGGAGGMGGDPRDSDAVVLANLLREVGFY